MLTQPDPTRPAKIRQHRDPTRPDPRVHPTRGQLWAGVAGSRFSFLSSGVTCARLNFLWKDPSTNDRDASLEIIGAKVFTHFLRSDVGMMSIGEDLHGMERMISATWSLVVGSVMLNSVPVYRTSDIKWVGTVPVSLEEILARSSLTFFMINSAITWANPPSLPASLVGNNP